MRTVPPVVWAAHVQGAAFLLQWERAPGTGEWEARIAWVEVSDDGTWFVRGRVVPAKSVRQIPGQDYSGVPRDARPRDPSDPRDPGYGQDSGFWGPRPSDPPEPDF